MPFGVDVKGITAKLDERFGQMMEELRAMRATLEAILGELRTQRGGTP